MSDDDRDGLFWLPWHTGRFARSTVGWPLVARAIYRELLDAQWDLNGLPADVRELQRIAGATDEEWSIGWGRCAEKFKRAGGKLFNQRLEQYRAQAIKNRQSASEKGLKGAAVRWGKHSSGNTSVNAPAIPEPIPQPMLAQWPLTPSLPLHKTSESKSAKSASGNGKDRPRRAHDLPVPANYAEDLVKQQKATLAELQARIEARAKKDDLPPIA